MAVATGNKLINLNQFNNGLIAANNKIANLAELTSTALDEMQDKIIALIKGLINAEDSNIYFGHSTTQSYKKGDIVIKTDEGTVSIYRCILSTSGNFQTSKFERLKMYGDYEIANLGKETSLNIIDILLPIKTDSSNYSKGWQYTTECPGYKYRYRIFLPYNAENSFPIMYLANKDSALYATEANICPLLQNQDGGIIIYTKKVPKSQIKLKLILLNYRHNQYRNPGVTGSTSNRDVSSYPTDNVFTVPIIISLPTTGWVSDSTIITGGVKYTYSNANILEDMIFCAIVNPVQGSLAESIELSPITVSANGSLTFYAKSAPSTAISVQIACVNYKENEKLTNTWTLSTVTDLVDTGLNLGSTDLIFSYDQISKYLQQNNFFFNENMLGHCVIEPDYIDNVSKNGIQNYNPVINGSIRVFTQYDIRLNDFLFKANFVCFNYIK